MRRTLYLGVDPEKAMRRVSRGMSFRLVRKAYHQASEAVGVDENEERRKVPPGESFEPESAFNHLADVARDLCVVRAPPEAIAGGLLHDVHEDYPEQWPEERLREEFGDVVAELVLAVSKPKMREIQEPEKRWRMRNDAYLEQLSGVVDKPIQRWALGISCADKCSNLSWSNYKMGMGVNPNMLMKHQWEWDMARLLDLHQLFKNHVPTGMLLHYRELLSEFWSLAIAHTRLPDDMPLIERVIREGLHGEPS